MVLLLPLAMILGALIALAVIIDSPGPVLYRGERVGRDGRPFRLLKFRTMRRETRGTELRVKGDVRQTPLGRALSTSRLDEFPQMLNVLRGDMSLVGPRPELREFVDELPAAFAEILVVRPGLTGPTQLDHLDEASVLGRIPATTRRDFYVRHLLPDKVASDIAYVRSHSVAGDFRILARTAISVLPGARRSPAASTAGGAGWALILTLSALYAAQLA